MFLILAATVAWLAILTGAWLGWQLLRQNGRILLRLEELEQRLNETEFGEAEVRPGLSVGSEAPPFDLLDLVGDRRALADFRGHSLLLIFFNPACGYCRELAPKLAAFYGVHRQEERDIALPAATSSGGKNKSAVIAGALQSGCTPPPQVLVITTGDAEANRQLFDEHKLICPVLMQKQVEVATAYQANGTPSGYLINAEGNIASQLAMGAEALLARASGQGSQPSTLNAQLAGSGNGEERTNRFKERSLARSKIKREGLKAGTVAPDFRLPRPDGRGELSLGELRGRRVLLVFSSPGCGPCNALAPELEKFHREHSEFEVVMISKGEPKENRAKVKEHGLTFPIVLQQQWEVSRRYAMFATPIAYMVDQAGVISHDVAVGVESIQTLMAKVATGPLEARQV